MDKKRLDEFRERQHQKDGSTVYHEVEISGSDVQMVRITPTLIRDCVLQGGLTSGPGEDKRYMPTQKELDDLVTMATWAVNRGQVIDFGHWPNDMIREVAARGGVLYAQGALGHPFRTPYIILHTWQDLKLPFASMLSKEYPDDPNITINSCAYLINPLPDPQEPKELCIHFEAATLEGMMIKGVKLLGVGDRVLVDAKRTRESGHYAAYVIPFLFRWPEILTNEEARKMVTNREGHNIETAAACNVCDPIMCALTLLNTRGVRQEIVAVDAKLNKARARRGKPPIPPHRRVDSKSYVTMVMDRIAGVRRPAQGGTHASPIMHVRWGHWRQYETGAKSFVRDTIVNASADMREQFYGRSNYRVSETNPRIVSPESKAFDEEDRRKKKEEDK